MFGRAILDKLPECIFENFENFEGGLSHKSLETNMRLMVNYTKKHFVSKLMF